MRLRLLCSVALCVTLVFALCRPAQGHNGVLAVAPELTNITIDGDFSDWPEGLAHYPITNAAYGEPPTGAADFDASFQIGYSEDRQEVYVAVTVRDDHTVIDTTDGWNTQDGCEIYAYLNHREVPSSSQREAYTSLQFSIYGDTRITLGNTRLRAPYSVEVQREGNTARYEWKVDVGALSYGNRPLFAYAVLALDVIVIDKDRDESYSWMAWGPGVNKWAFAERLGDIFLVGDDEALSAVSGQVVWQDVEQGNAQGKVVISSPEVASTLVVTPDSSGHFASQLPPLPYVFQGGYRRSLSEPESVRVESTDSLSIAPLYFSDPPYGIERALPSLPVANAGSGLQVGSWYLYNMHDGLAANRVNSIRRDSAGVMWFGTAGGVSVFDGIAFTTLAVGSGIAGNEVSCIYQTSAGEHWIGTSSGISRYHGDQITTYTTVDGLAGDWVSTIFEDRQGRLWIGTQGGISQFNGLSFDKIDTGFGFNVRAIAQDKDDVVWIATSRGLTAYDGEVFTNYTVEEGLPSDDITALFVASDGTLWVGTKDRGAFYLRGDRVTLVSPADAYGVIDDTMPDPSEITCIAEDAQAVIWVGSTAGLHTIRDEVMQPIMVADDSEDRAIRSLYHDGISQMWVGTDEGIRRFDGFVFTTLSNGQLSAERATTIAQDKAGTVWVGTTDGLRAIRGDQVERVEWGEDGPSLLVERLFIADNDDVWIGTNSGLIRHRSGVQKRFDKQALLGQDPLLSQRTPQTQSTLVDSSFVRSFVQGRRGVVWVATSQGLLQYDNGTFRTFSTRDGLPSNELQAAVEDDQGVLWIATASGLSAYDGTQFTNYSTDQGLPSNWINDLLVSADGSLWIATPRGISQYDGRVFRTFAQRNGLKSNAVQAISETKDGTLWIVTDQGISLMRDGAFVDWRMSNGSSYGRVNALIQARNGVVWLATDEGVVRYDGATTQELIKRDGLNSNYIASILEAQNGDFWFLTDLGITRLRQERSDPTVLISSVVADKVYLPGSVIQVPTTQQRIAIGFKAMSYQTRRNLIQFAYRLTGHDEQWRFTRDHEVYYDDLPSGAYSFEVKAIDRAFNYSDQSASVDFEVIYVPGASSIGISSLQIEDLYASFYKSYATRPVATVQLFNKNEIPIEATLQYYLPELMKRPTQKNLTLPANAQITVPINAILDNTLLQITNHEPWDAEIKLSYSVGTQTFSIEENRTITVHGKGMLNWDTIARAAAFITPEDPAVADFARSMLTRLDDFALRSESWGTIPQAMLMFEGLNALGVRYAADANTPFQVARENAAAIDHIQYPVELMRSQLGDCDDNTVLLCSLLENVRISTALVDVPGHILMMFDSGIHPDRILGTQLNSALFVEHAGRLWVPIEVTVLGEGRLFVDAWELGAKILQRVDTRVPGNIVIVSDAWQDYPYGDVQDTGLLEQSNGDLLRDKTMANFRQLEGMRDDFFYRTYIRPLLADPTDHARRLIMSMAYIEAGQFSEALTHLPLISGQWHELATYLIGYSYAGLGDIGRAAHYIEEASRLNPDHLGYMASLCWIYSEQIAYSNR